MLPPQHRPLVRAGLISGLPRFFPRGTGVGLLLVAVGLTGAGCRKTQKTDTAAAPAPEVLEQQAKDHMPVAAPPPATTSAAIVQANGEPDLGELNRSLLRWILRTHRRPNDFEDFAATAGVAIPPPPPGKKYVIGKDMHINLVNQ